MTRTLAILFAVMALFATSAPSFARGGHGGFVGRAGFGHPGFDGRGFGGAGFDRPGFGRPGFGGAGFGRPGFVGPGFFPNRAFFGPRVIVAVPGAVVAPYPYYPYPSPYHPVYTASPY